MAFCKVCMELDTSKFVNDDRLILEVKFQCTSRDAAPYVC